MVENNIQLDFHKRQSANDGQDAKYYKKILNKTKCISHLEEQERCSLAKGPNIIRLCLFVHILRSEQFMEWTYNVN